MYRSNNVTRGTNRASQHLYACAELAQHLIRAFAKSHSWTLETWPGKVRLPQDILRALPSPEAGREVSLTFSVVTDDEVTSFDRSLRRCTYPRRL